MTNDSFDHTRRSILRTSAALIAMGGVGTATAAQYPAWDPNTAYSGGDRVEHNGTVWEANWWTKGDEPSASASVWTEIGPAEGGEHTVSCADVAAWDSTTAYTSDDQVVHNGALWTAQWWTKGTEPASSAGAWTREGTCSDDGGSGNTSPTASFTVTPVSPTPGESVTLDASDSADTDGSIQSYDWSLGDGTSATGQTVSHTYDGTGEYTVSLTVTDDGGATATDSTTLTVATDGGGGSPAGNRIVGYWMQWAQYAREYTPADIPTDKVTHLQYAFMVPESDGTISGLSDSHAQRFLFPKSYHDVTSFGDISANTDVTCLISIGGWNDSGNFSDAAYTQARRETFAQECVRIIREAGVDGVDIDWEYPGGGGLDSNTVREGDQHRFTLLIEEVRNALDAAGQEDGREYHLSVALTASPETAEGATAGNNGLEHDRLSELLDFASIMTFDYAGGWSSYSAHQSPLHHNPANSNENAADWNISSGLQYYVDNGWDPGQLNMATPFYGRSFASVGAPDGNGNDVDDGLFQPFDGTGGGSFPPDTDASGIYDYWDIATSGGERSTSQIDLSAAGWETMYDETAVGAYSYNADQGMLLSHETPQTIQEKTTWLTNNDYGGTMIWALSHDTVDHTLLTALANGLL
ncbi:glycosyl hydrolase family 18 protein [Halocatena halophila]|uniref:glycosyl hydrolase family 18 protein n=1 Tax=Halocatena halophila TaxID=2814576 RepID=UPI002ED4A5C3